MKKNFLVYILIILISVSIFITLNNSVNKKISDNKSDKKSKFTLFEHKIKTDFVKVIDVYGPISFTGEKNLFGIRYGADYIIQQITSAEQNAKNIGLLLRINSPGGTVAASQEIYNAILNYKNKTNRKVITSMADIAASGGYYIAAASDTIFANSGTLTGSIGVIINGFNLEQLLKKIGVQSQTFKSDKHKDILSPYRPVSDTETKILQNTVINVYNQFINAVMDNRQNRIINDTSTLFDGRIFTGEQALKNGLIDKIGTYNDALEYLWKISGKTGLPVTDSKDGKEFLFKILQNFSQKNNFLSQIKLNNFQTPILYLFKN